MRVAFVLRSVEVQPLFRDLCKTSASLSLAGPPPPPTLSHTHPTSSFPAGGSGPSPSWWLVPPWLLAVPCGRQPVVFAARHTNPGVSVSSDLLVYDGWHARALRHGSGRCDTPALPGAAFRPEAQLHAPPTPGAASPATSGLPHRTAVQALHATPMPIHTSSLFSTH